MRYDKAPARRLRIAELVRESGYYSTSELSQLMEVSEMTVWRDLRLLAKDGLVEVVHGGAKSTLPRMGSFDYRMRLKSNPAAKRAIAHQAIEYVQPNTIVAIDAGTTALELARALPADYHLTVVTHSLPVMNLLSGRQDIELIGLGGRMQNDTQALSGPLTIATINELRINTFFLGMNAIQNGLLYSSNIYETEVKRALMAVADQVILLVDASKFHATAGIRVAGLDEVDIVVVDDSLPVDVLDLPSNVQVRHVLKEIAGEPETGMLGIGPNGG